MARFDLAGFRALPDGDVDLIVVGGDAEHRCKLTPANRLLLK